MTVAATTGGGILLQWGPTIPGREALILDVFTQGLGYLDRLIADARLGGRQTYLAMDGDLGANGGFLLVTGTLEQLRALAGEDDWQRFLLALTGVGEGLTVGLYGGGDDESASAVLALHVEVQTQLGLLGTGEPGFTLGVGEA